MLSKKDEEAYEQANKDGEEAAEFKVVRVEWSEKECAAAQANAAVLAAQLK